ncbi:hypothetical protein Tcan_11369 [Toxocara canis]|uniref:Uncharacterized protein n=1 Tax=Toxocara canis TaxID=6265 RepID=A0A0B2VET6_TOXCA|nr:hypothetical protein Tcan_11369 [Toxocara canis]
MSRRYVDPIPTARCASRSRSYHGSSGRRRTMSEVCFIDDDFLVAPPSESSEEERFIEVEHKFKHTCGTAVSENEFEIAEEREALHHWVDRHE